MISSDWVADVKMLFIMLLYSEIIGLFFSNSKLQKHLINGKKPPLLPTNVQFIRRNFISVI